MPNVDTQRVFGTLKKRPERLAAYTNADNGNTLVLPTEQEYIYFVYFQLTDTDWFGEIRVAWSHRARGHTLGLDNSHADLQDILGNSGKLQIDADSVTFGGETYTKTDDNVTLDPEHIVRHQYPE